MELLNESPPTGVLSMNSLNHTQASLNAAVSLVNACPANSLSAVSNSAAVFSSSSSKFSNSGALSLSNLNSSTGGVGCSSSSELNLSSSTNNLSSGLSTSSFSSALASTKYTSSPSLPNCLAVKHDFSHQLPYAQRDSNKFDLNKHCLSDFNLSSVQSPISTNSSLKSSSVSSSISNHSLSSSNNNLTNLCSNSSSSNCNNSFVNSNLTSLNNLSNNFCAQQLFNATSPHHHHNHNNHNSNNSKVKRTRQRVDAGEPRNSYASITNYASNRLGKAPKSFANASGLLPNKGLFDQLGYLGLNALLAGNQFTADDFLIQHSPLANCPAANSPAANASSNSSINTLLASLAAKDNECDSTPPPPSFANLPVTGSNVNVACLSPSSSNQLTNQEQMILNQTLWNTTNQSCLNTQSDHLNSPDSANHLNAEQQSNLLIDNSTMAKCRFTEDAVALDYNAKGKLFFIIFLHPFFSSQFFSLVIF